MQLVLVGCDDLPTPPPSNTYAQLLKLLSEGSVIPAGFPASITKKDDKDGLVETRIASAGLTPQIDRSDVDVAPAETINDANKAALPKQITMEDRRLTQKKSQSEPVKLFVLPTLDIFHVFGKAQHEGPKSNGFEQKMMF